VLLMSNDRDVRFHAEAASAGGMRDLWFVWSGLNYYAA